MRSGTDEDVLKEHQLIREEITADASAERATVWEFFKNPQYRKQLIAGIIIIAGPQLTGITLIFYYSEAIFVTAGVPVNLASYYTIGRLSYFLLIINFFNFY